jgi:hypothetical protein
VILDTQDETSDSTMGRDRSTIWDGEEILEEENIVTVFTMLLVEVILTVIRDEVWSSDRKPEEACSDPTLLLANAGCSESGIDTFEDTAVRMVVYPDATGVS